MRLPVAVRAVIILGAVFAATGCSRSTDRTANTTGGALVATIRSSPATFNRLVGQERALDLLGRLTYGQLIRINRSTWEVEPWLAESWTSSPDHLRYTIKLRPNVTFSDGHPFTSDDVVFSFAAVYEEKTASPLADAMMV